MNKIVTTEDHDLASDFRDVRDRLLQEKFRDRLAKPLGYWVLPNDRRLPLAFLGRTVGDLLQTPFSELSATPGIGQKKINSLVQLLDRATRDEPPAVPVGGASDSDTEAQASVADTEQFDPSVVSEALWSQWRAVVREYGVGEETLGRLAPSLQNLPTVIWDTRLKAYLDSTVSEIRRLRTHGEKRVRCVLEVFHSVYHRLQDLPSRQPVDLHRYLTAPGIRQVHDWVQKCLTADRLPTEQEVREQFATPLLQQIQIDSGETVYRLAAERIGVDAEPVNVRTQARQLGVTRARIYQLLDDCFKVLHVRWPEGQDQIEALNRRFGVNGRQHPGLKLYYQVCELCFPEKQRDEVASSATDDRRDSSPQFDADQGDTNVLRKPGKSEFGKDLDAGRPDWIGK